MYVSIDRFIKERVVLADNNNRFTVELTGYYVRGFNNGPKQVDSYSINTIPHPELRDIRCYYRLRITECLDITLYFREG
jgi:hypothetical protein